MMRSYVIAPDDIRALIAHLREERGISHIPDSSVILSSTYPDFIKIKDLH